MAKKETHMTEDAKLYELGFHIIPTAGEEKAAEAFSVITNIISENNGEVVKSAEPKAMKLAYPIIKKVSGKNSRFNESFFAWIKFTAGSQDIESIKELVDANESILRYIIVKTVDDDEHSTSKLVQEEASEETELEEVSEEPKNESEDKEIAYESSDDDSNDSEDESDEIDKAIDELVEEK